MLNVYEQVAINKRRSTLIIILFVMFVVIIGWLFASVLEYGPGFIGTAFVISGVSSFASYFWSDKIILGISNAKKAEREEYFDFYTAAENLAMAADIPKPELYIIEDSSINAFATGRDPDHAVICATTGMLDRLDRTEVEAVIAHEITHIKSYDIRLMSIVTLLVGTIALLGDWMIRSRIRSSSDRKKGQGIILLLGIILAVLSPIIAKLIQLAISRRREYSADVGAVKLTRQPTGLISALRKISIDKEPLEAANRATAHLYIANPLKNLKKGVGAFSGLFQTHPPVEKRIENLEKML